MIYTINVLLTCWIVCSVPCVEKPTKLSVPKDYGIQLKKL